MLMLMFFAPRAGPVSDRACKYKYSCFVLRFFFSGILTIRGWLKTFPRGCIVRFSVTGKFFICCVGFNRLLTLIMVDRIWS